MNLEAKSAALVHQHLVDAMAQISEFGMVELQFQWRRVGLA